jgi:hypothetical protein
MNAIQNHCPVTVEDVNISEKILTRHIKSERRVDETEAQASETGGSH